MALMGFVTGKDIAIKGERLSLAISVTVVVLLALFVSSFNTVAAVFAMLTAIVYVKFEQGAFIARMVKVSDQQLEDIYKLGTTAANRLSMSMPDIFVNGDRTFGAFSMGILGKKSIVLHSGLVEVLDPEELLFIIGHEFTHIKLKHTSWLVLKGTDRAMRIPIFSGILSLIFSAWSRKAEYSCDRGGLVSCRNVEAAKSAMAKLMVGKELFNNLCLDTLVKQRIEVGESLWARLCEFGQSHPHTVHRIHQLEEFFAWEQYQAILKKNVA